MLLEMKNLTRRITDVEEKFDELKIRVNNSDHERSRYRELNQLVGWFSALPTAVLIPSTQQKLFELIEQIDLSFVILPDWWITLRRHIRVGLIDCAKRLKKIILILQRDES